MSVLMLVMVAFVLVLVLSEVEVKLEGLLVEKQLEQVVALLAVVMDLRQVELVEAVVVGSLERIRVQL